MIGETFDTNQLIDGIQGNLTVELRDADTEKVVEKVESKNFIAQAGVRQLKYIQRANYFKNGISSLNASADTDYAWPATQDHIVLTDSTEATNSSSEWNMPGKVIGYAGKYTYAGACDLLGSANSALSEATPTYTKWIFDWPTNAGNGTFGSVGWMLAASTYQGNGTLGGRFYTSCTQQDTKTVSSNYIRLARASSSQYFFAVAGGPSIIVADSNFAQTNTFSVGSQFKSGTNLIGIAWDSGNNKLWVLGLNASSAPIIAAYNASGALVNGPTTITNRSYASLTFDGTDLWTMVSTTENTFTLYKISTNGSDAANVTINLPTYTGSYPGERAYALAYETSTQYIYIATWARYYPGGSYSSNYGGGMSVNSGYTTSSIRAFDTSGNEKMVPVSLNAYVASTATRYWLNNNGLSFGGNSVMTYDLEMIDRYQGLIPYGFSPYSVVRFLCDGMGSRSLLPSPITKTNAQTLRITYQMDYL